MSNFKYFRGIIENFEQGFESVVFPVVRRVASRLLANDLISVQAMGEPSGQVFFIDPPNHDVQDRFPHPDRIDGNFKYGRNNQKFKYFKGYVERIPEVNLNLRTVEVTAGNRRIRATWNPELAHDIEHFHEIDAEAELTRILQDEISERWERENLNL